MVWIFFKGFYLHHIFLQSKILNTFSLIFFFFLSGFDVFIQTWKRWRLASLMARKIFLVLVLVSDIHNSRALRIRKFNKGLIFTINNYNLWFHQGKLCIMEFFTNFFTCLVSSIARNLPNSLTSVIIRISGTFFYTLFFF